MAHKKIDYFSYMKTLVVIGGAILIMLAGVAFVHKQDWNILRAQGPENVSVQITLGNDIQSSASVNRTIEFFCSTGGPATVTSCLADQNDFGCSFNLKEGGSCVGRSKCTYICDHTFNEGDHNNYTLKVLGKNSEGATRSSEKSIRVDITDPFRADSIVFSDSGGGAVNPRSQNLIITTSLEVGSISGTPSFTPSQGALVDTCAYSGRIITCTLQKMGIIANHDVFINPELSQITINIPYGFAQSSGASGSKQLQSNSETFHIGCVLRKVNTRATESAPQDDLVVGDNDGWGICSSDIFQQYRAIKLRNLSCSLAPVTEMRACGIKQPEITQSILRDLYTDVDIKEDPLTDSRFLTNDKASFGPLGSKVTVRGKYFQPNPTVSFVNSQPNPVGWQERTFTEVWLGGVKIAGVGRYTVGGDVPFLPNGAPVCLNAECAIRALVQTEVPECSNNIEVHIAVKPLVYGINTVNGFPEWDHGDNSQIAYRIGGRVFVVVPSVQVANGYRGAEFTFSRADHMIMNQFNRYLNGKPENRAPVGLPLAFTMEASYLNQNAGQRSCIYGGSALCGFGEHATTEIGFFNESSQDKHNSLFRAEQTVDFFEVGKPWKRAQVFPLTPFMRSDAEPGRIWSYVCGGSIGFIQSNNNSESASKFQLVREPFAIHQISPSWGKQDIEKPAVSGYDLGGGGITATLGDAPIAFVDDDNEYRLFDLPNDSAQPEFTSKSLLKLCRNGFCASMTVPVIKQSFNPGSWRVPEIDSVTPLQNWQAQPLKTMEDRGYMENYCAREELVIKGNGFGFEQGNAQVSMWSPSLWRSLGDADYKSWSDGEITIAIPPGGSLLSVDCPRDHPDFLNPGVVSDLTLPIRICRGNDCVITNQKDIFARPPARARIVHKDEDIEKNNYCLNDIITITGEDFGPERLGAHLFIKGKEVGRYLSWSPTKIRVTPPPFYSGKRAPGCPRHAPQDGILTDLAASSLSDFSLQCPNPQNGARFCSIISIDPLPASVNNQRSVDLYHKSEAVSRRLCANDIARIHLPSPFTSSSPLVVSFFSPEDGWREADKILKEEARDIIAQTPRISGNEFSPDCPRAVGSDRLYSQAKPFPEDAAVSIFTGPIRACKGGSCYYFDAQNVSFAPANNLAVSRAFSPVRLWRDTATFKQYLVGETVRINGRYFSDARSQSELATYRVYSNDERNSAYVEFYSDDLGFVPAGGYLSWTDEEIVATAPAISLEDAFGGPQGGVSVAKWPVRVCTRYGCSTNLVPPLRYKNDAVSGLVRDKKYWPEITTVSPSCMPADSAAPQDIDSLLTVYGKDLDKTDAGYLILDDGARNADGSFGSKIPLEVYKHPQLQFEQKFKDYIIFKVPARSIQLPQAVNTATREEEAQVITGKLFITSSWYRNKAGEVGTGYESPAVVVFSKYCQAPSECIGAPYIKNTNSRAYAEHNFMDVREEGKTINIDGCNFGKGTGSSAFIGDINEPHERMGPTTIWEGKKIFLNAPTGAAGGLLGLNVWTGLLAYPAVWGEITNNSSQNNTADLVVWKKFEILPTIAEITPRVASGNPLVLVYGSGFCVEGNCALPLERFKFGVWQSPTSPIPDIAYQTEARLFDVTPGSASVYVPREQNSLKSAGDASYALSLSGQVRAIRPDGEMSRPFFRAQRFNPAADLKQEEMFLGDTGAIFVDAPQYFTAAPAVFQTIPRSVSQRERVRFNGAEFTGLRAVSPLLVSPFRPELGNSLSCTGEKFPLLTARDMPYPLPTDVPSIVVGDIYPLPTGDLCLYCSNEIITIFGAKKKFDENFGKNQGSVFFWSTAGWRAPVTYLEWTNTRIRVRFNRSSEDAAQECKNRAGSDGYPSLSTLPLKLCRALRSANAHEECVVWYGPATDDLPLELWSVNRLLVPDNNREYGRFAFNTLKDSTSLVSDIFPLSYYKLPEREVLINHPVKNIITNWDGSFGATQNFSFDQEHTPVYFADVQPVQCLYPEKLNPPLPGDYPEPITGSPPIRVKKISPVLLPDACRFCLDDPITIDGMASASRLSKNFGANRGKVYFWDGGKWVEPLVYELWNDTRIRVRITRNSPSGANKGCPRNNPNNGQMSSLSMPIKICRSSLVGASAECAVFTVYPYLKAEFQSGVFVGGAVPSNELADSSKTVIEKRTYAPPENKEGAKRGMTARLTLPADELYAEHSVIERIDVDPNKKGALRTISLFVNMLYNDVDNIARKGLMTMNLFSSFGEPSLLLGGFSFTQRNGGGGFSFEQDQQGVFSTREYNGEKRFVNCENQNCEKKEWLFPGEKEDQSKFFSYGILGQDVLCLKPDAIPADAKASYGADFSMCKETIKSGNK